MVLLVQKISLNQKLSSILENHHHHYLHHCGHRPSEANSASLQDFFHSLSAKLENHHHHHPSETLSASLKAFRSDVSNCLSQLTSNPKPGSEFLSLRWIQQCFELLPIVNKAFAKLLVEIDYQMSKWEASFIDEYLNYTLNLLELLNSISSSLSHLSQARLSLSHAISLIQDSPSLAIQRFREFPPKSFNMDLKVPQIGQSEERLCYGEEHIIHKALMDMKKIGLWVCGIVLSSLCSDIKPYMEMRNSARGFADSSLITLDSRVSNEVIEKQGTLKEVREINEAVACLVSAMANEDGDGQARELKRRLEVLEKGLMDVKKEGDSLFSEVLSARDGLLENLRSKSNSTT